MKKKTLWRVNVAGQPVRRHNLRECLPLSVPLSIDIEASSVCNLKCRYCPQSLPDEKKKEINIGCSKTMSFETFEKIADQCKEFSEPLKNIRFAGFGEPLVNKDITSMVYAIKSNHLADTVTIFSNGLLLTEELSERLVEAGVDTFLFDIQGINEEDYRYWGGVDIDFKKLYDNLCYLHSLPKRGKIFIKTFKSIVKSNQKEFYRLFDRCSDEIGIENIYEIYPEIDYTGMVMKEKETLSFNFSSSKYCSYPWFQMAVDAAGRVTACTLPISKNSDFLCIGNVHEEKLTDLWNGKKLNDVRYKLITDRDGCVECKDCRYTDLLPEEDLIDEVVHDLEKFLLSRMDDKQ